MEDYGGGRRGELKVEDIPLTHCNEIPGRLCGTSFARW